MGFSAGSGTEVDFSRLQGPVSHLTATLAGIRSQPSEAYVDSFKIEAYGSQATIGSIASSVSRGDSIVINPYDPALTTAIAKSLLASGLNAYAADKRTVIVSFPPPSGEEAERICKHVAKLGEEAKIAIRAVRHELRKLHPDDDKVIQEATDAAVVAVDAAVKAKIASFASGVIEDFGSRHRKDSSRRAKNRVDNTPF